VNWKLWVGIVISGLLLFFAARNVDLQSLLSILKEVHYWYLVPVVFFTVLCMWIRALRWHFLLQPIKRIPIGDLFSATMIGFMANNLFPARFGELVRALTIGKKANIGRSASFATIVLERVFDGFTILIFLIILLLFFPIPLPHWLGRATKLAVGIYALVLLFLIGLRIQTTRFMALFRLILKPLPQKIHERILHIIKSFVSGLQILHDAKNIIIASFLSLLVWTTAALSVYFLILAFDFHLPVYSAFFLQIILCLGVALPSAPGYIGTIQFVCVTGLALFGIEHDSAFSFSLLYHAGQFIPITGIGLVYFFMEGFTFGQMKGSIKKYQASEEE